ncbi:hypothetical protein B4U80_11978, partial [Leptotrombidium deliense]
VTIGKLSVLVILLDDQQESCGDDKEVWNLIRRFEEVISNDEIVEKAEDNWFISALRNVWQEFVSQTPRWWRKRFAAEIKTLIAAFFEETKIGKFPTVTEYFSLRPILVGMNISFMLGEFAKNQYLSEYDRASIALQEFCSTAYMVGMLTNDVFSYKYEKENGFNLMKVYKKYHQLNEAEAASKVVDLLEKHMSLYKIKRKLIMLPACGWFYDVIDVVVKGLFEYELASPRYDIPY